MPNSIVPSWPRGRIDPSRVSRSLDESLYSSRDRSILTEQFAVLVPASSAESALGSPGVSKEVALRRSNLMTEWMPVKLQSFEETPRGQNEIPSKVKRAGTGNDSRGAGRQP